MLQALTALSRANPLSQLPKYVTASSRICVAQAAITRQSIRTGVKNATGTRTFSTCSKSFVTRANSASARVFSTHVLREETSTSHAASRAKEFWALCVIAGVGAAVVVGSSTCFAEQNSAQFAARIVKLQAFLTKPKNTRTLDDRLEFIDEIFKVGDEQAEAIKDRDIIAVIGTTNAGKSTFLDYMNGCDFTKVNNRVKVAPNSKQKEIAQIGRGLEPTTICPQAVQINREHFCDLPGFSDPRGFEVNIGICDNVRKIYDNAKSVRTIYLIDYNSIVADGGTNVPNKLNLLNEVFNDTLTSKRQDGFVVIITHAEDVSPTQAIEDLKKAANGFPLSHVYVYDPMMNDSNAFNDHRRKGYISRNELWTLFRGMPKVSQANTIQLKLSIENLAELQEVAGVVKHEMEGDLKKGKAEDLKAANDKLKFFKGLKERFDTEIGGEMQVGAQKVLHTHIKNAYINKLDNKHSLNDKSKKYAEYLGLKEIISEGYYEQSDEEINQRRTEDTKNAWFYETRPLTTEGVGGLGTVVVGGAAAAAGAVAVPIVLGVAGVGLMGHAGWKYFYPTKEDKHWYDYFRS